MLLFSFKTPDAPTTSGRPGPIAFGTPATGGTATPVTGESTPVPPDGASPTTAATQPPAGGTQQVDGDVVSTRFGDVQVRIVESGGKIVDVQPLQLPFDRSRSLEISQYVAPILDSEALQAQSAQIDTISGATYTSYAYQRSLQSALDRVHG